VPEPGTPMVPLEAVFYECAVSVAFALKAHAVPWPADPPGTVRIRTDDLEQAALLLADYASGDGLDPYRRDFARVTATRLRAALEQPS
jgi:hypothetical protein